MTEFIFHSFLFLRAHECIGILSALLLFRLGRLHSVVTKTTNFGKWIKNTFFIHDQQCESFSKKLRDWFGRRKVIIHLFEISKNLAGYKINKIIQINFEVQSKKLWIAKIHCYAWFQWNRCWSFKYWHNIWTKNFNT